MRRMAKPAQPSPPRPPRQRGGIERPAASMDSAPVPRFVRIEGQKTTGSRVNRIANRGSFDALGLLA